MSRITRPSSAGAAANRSIAASASATSPSVPRSSSVSTRTPVAGMPHASSRPSRNRWSTAARMSGMASSRSPRRALSRATYTLTIGNSHRLCPRRRNTSLTSASSFCPRSRSAAVWRCTSASAQRHPGEANARSSPDRSAIRRASSISRIADRRAPARQPVSPGVDLGDDRGVGHGVGAAGHGQAVPQVVAPSGTTQAITGNSPLAKANANGDPKMKLPLDGSPSARSMTLCDHRSTSLHSALSALA